ncbi:hypothetical protein NDU88_002235 [Pleurodeles waltl]|uniref:Uncharacterized protein n=1 Tax=Pleurodeles waltl TaxID=8319 RepID=A0AAV7PB19_PLEWA|nr:hypothetical protein NDU88_002235 [Pleurodeles waltl]
MEAEKSDGPSETQNDPPTPVAITQDFLSHFLQEIRSETGSLKDDLKPRIKDVRQEVTEIGEHVDDLEKVVDASLEGQEQLRRGNTLEHQNLELQSKEEDLENQSCCNSLQI